MTSRQTVMLAIALVVLVMTTQGCDSLRAQGRKQLHAEPTGGELTGTSADEILIGGAGEDYLYGKGGKDEFHPGSPGGALMVGGTGDDTYVLKTDSGLSIIKDEGGHDTLKFASGITLDRLVFRDVPGGLHVIVLKPGEKPPATSDAKRWTVLLTDWGLNPAAAIERFQLADDSSITASQVEDRLSGERRPRLTGKLPTLHAQVGQPFRFAVPDGAFMDPEGQRVEIRIHGRDHADLPGWLTYQQSYAVVAGSPGASDRGTVNIEVSAEDPTGLYSIVSLQLIVQ